MRIHENNKTLANTIAHAFVRFFPHGGVFVSVVVRRVSCVVRGRRSSSSVVVVARHSGVVARAR